MHDWEQQNEIDAVFYGDSCAAVRIRNGRLTALDKPPAHNRNQRILRIRPRFLHMQKMSCMHRIVFYDNTCCHSLSFFLHYTIGILF